MFQSIRVPALDRWLAGATTASIILAHGTRDAYAQPCTEGEWVQVTPANSPPLGAGAMVYDTVRQVVVAVLDDDFGRVRNTWEWDGKDWSLRIGGKDIPFGPMAFDTVRGVTIVFDAGETWTWDGAVWTGVATTGPASGGAIAFDTDRGVAVLHGGNLRQTWEWDGAEWTFRFQSLLGKDTGDPQVVNSMSMCYDANARQTIMFGGTEGYSPVGETWAWDGTDWTRLGGGLQGRNDAPMTYDPVRQVRVLFGGWDVGPGGRYFEWGDTYESSLNMDWTLVDSTGPSPRGHAAMTYDAARNNIVLFGGYTKGGVFGDTWIRIQEPLSGGPSIEMHPESAEVPAGGTANFHVTATGEGTITYQWRRNGRALNDGGRISGTRTSTLTITGIRGDDEGSYDVIVTNPCESVTSNPATLDVLGLCAADVNADGALNSQDFFDFLTSFFALLPDADFDESGTIETADFFAYLEAFFAPCQ